MSVAVVLLIGGVAVQAIKPVAATAARRRRRAFQDQLRSLPMPAPDEALDALLERAAAALDRQP